MIQHQFSGYLRILFIKWIYCIFISFQKYCHLNGYPVNILQETILLKYFSNTILGGIWTIIWRITVFSCFNATGLRVYSLWVTPQKNPTALNPQTEPHIFLQYLRFYLKNIPLLGAYSVHHWPLRFKCKI